MHMALFYWTNKTCMNVYIEISEKYGWRSCLMQIKYNFKRQNTNFETPIYKIQKPTNFKV